MKLITVLLLLNLVIGFFYHQRVVSDYESAVKLQTELNKACEAELLWRNIQIEELKGNR